MQVLDEEALKKATVIDMSKLPMKTVPDEHFPRIVHRHPVEHYRKVVDRPTNAPAVERLVPNKSKELKVHNESELAKALKQGWRKDAFVPRPLEDADYGIEYEGDQK